jgi:hypothetical protein
MQSQPTEHEKMFVNNVLKERPAPRLYKEHLNTSDEKTAFIMLLNAIYLIFK